MPEGYAVVTTVNEKELTSVENSSSNLLTELHLNITSDKLLNYSVSNVNILLCT